MRLAAILLVLLAATSYLAWAAAISDHESNTVWSVLAAAGFYGSIMALIGLAGLALWRRRH